MHIPIPFPRTWTWDRIWNGKPNIQRHFTYQYKDIYPAIDDLDDPCDWDPLSKPRAMNNVCSYLYI